MKKVLILILLNLAFCVRGDIVSYEFQGEMNENQIQAQLDDNFGSLAPEVLYSIKLYSIVYETIDQFGNTTLASGLISYPDNVYEAYPIASFQHGTQIRRESAPSMNGFNDLVIWLASTGYVFIEPDYLGLGVSEMMHPYHLKDVTASSVIDMIIASKNFCNQMQDIQYNEQLYLFGYSEGGYATMAAVKEIEENYNNEISITASFPMAGAYDLSGTMADLMLSEEPYPDPFYLPFFILSYIEKYSMGMIDDFFKPEYSEIFPDLFTGEYSGSYINSFLPDIPIHMMLDDVVNEFSNNDDYIFRVYLEENDLWDWTPLSKMYLFHAIADESVPHENSVVAYNQFIENGAPDVYFESLPESYGGHQEAAPYCLMIAYDITEELKITNPIGDINADSILNILDIVEIVDIVLNFSSQNEYVLWAADLNRDQVLNILDIIELVNIILSYE